MILFFFQVCVLTFSLIQLTKNLSGYILCLLFLSGVALNGALNSLHRLII